MRVLEHQQLHHHHLVDVGPSPLGGPVVVEGLNDGGEGFPFYEGLYIGEFVASYEKRLRSSDARMVSASVPQAA